MNYNAVISVQDISDSSGEITEPVDLDEMKDYLRLNGFEDTEDSPATVTGTFTSDDILLTDMIRAARELIEEKAGISIIAHEFEAVITNLCGRLEIPYGPIIGVTSLKDSSDTLITSYTLVGNLWKYLKNPCQKEMTITYSAGYGDVLTTPLPRAIKIDIMRLVAYLYENRGDDAKIETFAFQLASKYSRRTAIL
jgi:hypothetical protein